MIKFLNKKLNSDFVISFLATTFLLTWSLSVDITEYGIYQFQPTRYLILILLLPSSVKIYNDLKNKNY